MTICSPFPRLSSLRFAAGVLALAAAVFAAEGMAQLERPDREIRALEPLGQQRCEIALRLADGVLSIPITLFNRSGERQTINLELVLNYPGTIELHPDMVDWLGIPPPEAGTRGEAVGMNLAGSSRVALHAAEIDITDEETFNRHNTFSVRHAEELQDRLIKGRIGLGFLKHFHFSINASTAVLKLEPRNGSPIQSRGRGFRIPFTEADGRIALRMASPAGEAVILGSGTFENRIAERHPGVDPTTPGRLTALLLAGSPRLDLAVGYAWRPVPWPTANIPAGITPVAVTGTDFVASNEIGVDWAQSVVQLVPLQDRREIPQEQLDYFRAEQRGTAEALEDFLETHPNAVFSAQAAADLLQKRIVHAAAAPEAFLTALRWVAETVPAKHRLETCIPTVEVLSQRADNASLTCAAGCLALNYAQACENVLQIYRLHRIIGIARFTEGNLEAAWRHLMSAAFVKTDADPNHLFLCSFYLGQLYEIQGRLGRAYSRYQAALRVKAASWEPPAVLRAKAELAVQNLRSKLTPEQLEELDTL